MDEENRGEAFFVRMIWLPEKGRKWVDKMGYVLCGRVCVDFFLSVKEGVCELGM